MPKLLDQLFIELGPGQQPAPTANEKTQFRLLLESLPHHRSYAAGSNLGAGRRKH